MTVKAVTFRLEDAVAHAKTLRAAGDFLASQHLFQQIADQLPDHPVGWLGLGEALLDQMKASEAIIAFEQAMRIGGATGGLHHALGTSKALLGRLLEAEAHYAEAVALEPQRAEFYFHYSRLRKFTTTDNLHLRIESLLEQDELTDPQRCHLHFAAGKIYDDIGQYDQAFDHLQNGNDCEQVHYDRDQWAALVDGSINVFDRSLLRRMAAPQSSAPPALQTIVFVVGMPRSGTTLVEQILASHSEVFGAGELPDLNLISSKLVEIATSDDAYPYAIHTVDSDALMGLGDFYRQRVNSLGARSASVVCDKLPSNYFFIGLMHGLFSNVRVIHCRRHPLDTALSCYANHFKEGQEFSYSLDDIAHYYRCYRRLMQHWEQVASIPILHVDYEQLVTDQESVSRGMIDFVGLPWQNECLEFQRTQRVVATASNWQVRQPLYQSSIGRWKRYARHLDGLKTSLLEQGILLRSTERIDAGHAEIKRPRGGLGIAADGPTK